MLSDSSWPSAVTWTASRSTIWIIIRSANTRSSALRFPKHTFLFLAMFPYYMSFNLQEEETWSNLQTRLLFPVGSLLIHSGHVQFLKSKQSFGVWGSCSHFEFHCLNTVNYDSAVFSDPTCCELLMEMIWVQPEPSNLTWALSNENVRDKRSIRPSSSFWPDVRPEHQTSLTDVNSTSLILQGSKFNHCYNVKLDMSFTSVTGV